MKKLIHCLTVGTKRLINRLGEFDTTIQPSQKYLFFIDPTSTRLVNMRGRTTVEHILGSARQNIQHFDYLDFPANATYHRLQPADAHLGDTWITVGEVLKDPPPLSHAQGMLPHLTSAAYGDKLCGQRQTRRSGLLQLLKITRPSCPQTAQSAADTGPQDGHFRYKQDS
jgi:hypothetical protein